MTIPRYIRRAMRLEKGDVLVFEAEDGGRVRVAREPVSFAEYAGKWREGKGKSVEEINAWLRELRGHEE